MAETLVKKEYVIKERNAANLDSNSKAIDLFDATDYKTTLTTSYQNFAIKGADEKVLVIAHNTTSGGGAADVTLTVKKQDCLCYINARGEDEIVLDINPYLNDISKQIVKGENL